ncbi:MAG: glucose 1-dehydrogenase [Chloroflexota bacterium]
MNNQLPNFDLTGKVAIVTGASRGIGEMIAKTYAAAGASVVVSSRKQDGVDAVADAIRQAGGDALAVAAHTGSLEAVDELVGKAVDAYGGVDIVVNNAATNPHFGPMITADESHWDKTLDVNVKGYFRTVKACVESMQSRGGGKVINIASVAGREPQAGMGIYCVSKAAVIMMTEVLASELSVHNIQVNAIAPGFIKTKFSSALWQNEDLYKSIVKHIPQRRMAETEELAGISLYLASGASSFTTGATFTVDGGQLVNTSM